MIWLEIARSLIFSVPSFWPALLCCPNSWSGDQELVIFINVHSRSVIIIFNSY
jgi:hypothetical protein